jgi:hypothetical protein
MTETTRQALVDLFDAELTAEIIALKEIAKAAGDTDEEAIKWIRKDSEVFKLFWVMEWLESRLNKKIKS